MAVTVAITLTLLIAALGLAIDGGRLYVIKAELQTVADACALAGARRLTCSATDLSCLAVADSAARAAAALNKAGFQSSTPSLAPGDITFSTALNGTYTPHSTSAAQADPYRFVRCTPSVGGITPWMMGVVGAGDSTVKATAVATTLPSQTASVGPIGICKGTATGGASSFGWNVGQWIKGTGNSLGASIRWVSLNGANNNPASVVSDQLAGSTLLSNVKLGDTVSVSDTSPNSVRNGYNTRFGIYAKGGGYSSDSNPPDATGYAYPSKSPGVVIPEGSSAFSDYMSKRSSNAAFDAARFAGAWSATGGSNGKGNDNAGGQAIVTPAGSAHRRLITVPVFQTCPSGNSAIVGGMACVLLLNPIDSGSDANLFIEYRGDASSVSSPCASAPGLPSPGGFGPAVPALVQ